MGIDREAVPVFVPRRSQSPRAVRFADDPLTTRRLPT
jgi:hypothetical protein